MRTVLWVAALSFVNIGGASADCVTGSYSFQFGQSGVIETTMNYVHGGSECLLGYRGGLRVTYDSIAVSKPPRYGSTRPHSSGHGVIYFANPGYSGPDSLGLRLCGKSATSQGCTFVSFAITVR
jgi:hypothetical protein